MDLRKPFSFGKEKGFRTFRKETLYTMFIDGTKRLYLCEDVYFIDICAIKWYG